MTVTAPGRWHVSEPTVVDPEHVSRFAEAVGEHAPELLAGEECPPTYPIVLGWRQQNQALDGVLPEDVLGLHGEQSFEYHEPIVPGRCVVSRSRLECVVPRRTGTTVTARTEVRDDERLLCTQLFTIFVVGRTLQPSGTPVPGAAQLGQVTSADLLGVVEEVIEPDQPHRYSEASGDTYRIHLDDQFARSFGLSGVIAHGMCTLAFAARAVRDLVCEPRGGELSYLAARFSAPVHPGEAVRTAVRASVSDGKAVGGFTTAVGDREVLTAGRFAAGPRAPRGGLAQPAAATSPR